MITTVQKWGNSLAIRIPKVILKTIGAYEGGQIRIIAQSHKMIIEVMQPETVNMERLIKKITPQNTHAEITWGSVVGDEVW